MTNHPPSPGLIITIVLTATSGSLPIIIVAARSSIIISIAYYYHYTIFTIVPINCLQKRIRIKFTDDNGQNIARLKLEVKHYVN